MKTTHCDKPMREVGKTGEEIFYSDDGVADVRDIKLYQCDECKHIELGYEK